MRWTAGGEGFLAGKLQLRDETFRRQENRRVCSGRREELFQQLGPQEGQELFLPAGGETGLWREGKGIFADGKGRFAGRECRAGAIPAAGRGGRGAFLPAGVKLGCGEKGKGSLQMERGGLREENAAGAIPAAGSAGGSGAFSPGGRPGPGSWRGGQRSLLE